MNTEEMAQELDLPGFRFHPTEEELLEFYLKNKVLEKELCLDIIKYFDIYHYNPWQLPGLAGNGEREWYFFVPKERRHGNGRRSNRTTANGFWKATGTDRKIVSSSEPKRVIGFRKTLVFYAGRAPKGTRTDWVMNEYRLPDSCCFPKDLVLCKVYRKATSLKVLEQRAVIGEEMKTGHAPGLSSSSSPLSTSLDDMSFSGQPDDTVQIMALKKNKQEKLIMDDDCTGNNYEKPKEIKGPNYLELPMGNDKFLALEMPIVSNMDWNHDGFWLNSHWLQNLL